MAMLCNLDHPIMSVQNAAGWGYFNTCVAEWNSDILQEAGFPTHLLPHVVKSGAIAGTLDRPWYGIPSGTPVGNVINLIAVLLILMWMCAVVVVVIVAAVVVIVVAIVVVVVVIVATVVVVVGVVAAVAVAAAAVASSSNCSRAAVVVVVGHQQ